MKTSYRDRSLSRRTRRLYRAFPAAFFFLVCIHVTVAQVSLRHEVLTTWTTEQGLPQDFVSAIAQTPDGLIWVGTYGGLARFDGMHFKTFATDAPSALRGYITGLVVGRDGQLWVGTAAGLFVYRERIFVPVFAEGAPGQAIDVMQLAGRGDGSVWIRTKSELLHGLGAKAVSVVSSVTAVDVLDMAAEDGDKLWVAEKNRVVLEQGKNAVGVFELPGVKLVYRAPEGRLFAGDGHRLFLLQGKRFVLQPKSGPSEFVGLLMDRKGALWMASGGLEGISRSAEGKLETLDKNAGLMSNDARVLFESRDGDIWIGTIAGLQRLHVGVFTSFTAKDGLAAGRNQYDAVFEDRQGAIWAGTLQEGITELVGDRWTVFGKHEGVRAGQVRGFAEGSEKPVFAMSDYGLFSWSGGTFRKVDGIPEGYVTVPLRAHDGGLWFSITRKGVFRMKDDKVTGFDSADGMASGNVWSLAESFDGDLWAGGTTGLSRWHNGRWARVDLPLRSVMGIATEPDGGLLLGTNAGLVFHKPGVDWKLTQADGLPSDSVFALAKDGLGDLWLATAGGICRIPHRQLEALMNGATKHVTPEVFTQEDGLISRSVLPIGQVTALRAHDGRIWFATTYGPTVAVPVETEEDVPRALLDDVVIDDRRVASDRAIVPNGRHRLAFDYTAPVFAGAEQIRFRYRLNDWDAGWIEAGTSRQASYVGLPPGDYTFEVQALGRTGLAGPVSRALALRVEPYFWQTRWFLFIAIVAVIAFVVEVTRRRTRIKVEAQSLRFQERATERERIALQIHDTFIQDLIGTALQLELVGLQLEEDPDVARGSLKELGVRLRGIIARSRDIISNLHSMAAPEEGLLELLQHVESEFRLSDAPHFAVISEGDEVDLAPYVRDEVYRICREAVANAFRHARAQEVVVAVRFARDMLVIRIGDDGVGMNEEMQSKGRAGHFGLSGMRAHALRIGAKLCVSSEQGLGTTVTLKLVLRMTPIARMKSIRTLLQNRLRAYTDAGDRMRSVAAIEEARRRSE